MLELWEGVAVKRQRLPSRFSKRPVGFLVYQDGILLFDHTITAKAVRALEQERPSANLEVFGVHRLVKFPEKVAT